MLYRLSKKNGEKGSLIGRSFQLPLTSGSAWRRTNNSCRQLFLLTLFLVLYTSPESRHQRAVPSSQRVNVMSYSDESVTALSPDVASSAHSMLWGRRSSPASHNFDYDNSSPSSPSFSGPCTRLDEVHNWSPPPVSPSYDSRPIRLT